ncbi:HD domain-containing protein (plasmid) [Rhodococcus globerulus]|uniref:HD domain-containing protein n=1 Tax=Rhodococcus globerulus TaxID=33008 RepID=UPI0039E7EA28
MNHAHTSSGSVPAVAFEQLFLTDIRGEEVKLPNDALAQAALDLISSVESAALANHSVRTFFFGRLLAPHLDLTSGTDYDERLLFLSSVLHDVGLSALAKRDQRFEVDGADRAAEFLTEQGLPRSEVDAVWEAIALHSSTGIAEKKNALCRLTAQGIVIDFGGAAGVAPEHLVAVTDELGTAIHSSYPRHNMTTTLMDAVYNHAKSHPSAAPRYTSPGEILRERTEAGITIVEEAVAAGTRWGN